MHHAIAERNSFKNTFNFFLVVVAGISTVLNVGAGVINGDFSAGNSGFTSDYTFIASGTSTTPGTFGIRTNSLDFNPGYNLFGDHTTGKGNMMLIDGNTGMIAWQETVTVAANTNYVFSAWVTPANSSNPSVLQFTINGVQVGATVTLSGTPGVWQQFVGTWSSGSATSAVLAITDQNGVSLGNDFALDDLALTEGTNAPVNQVTAAIYTAVEINWPSQANQSYQVQYRTNLNSSTWFDFGAPIPGTGTNNSVFDSTRGQDVKFYRVITTQ